MRQDYAFSKHAREMLLERNISENWVWRTIEMPHNNEIGKDGNMHYFKPIMENGGRVLHIVINPHVYPRRIVTVFFDRRF